MSRIMARSGSVHGRDRFIGHDQTRAQQVSARHHYPLALSPAELVRVFFQDLVAAQSDHVERVLDQFTSLSLVASQGEMAHDQVERVLDAEEWVEDLVRILENGLDLLAVGQALLAIQLRYINALVEDLPLCRRDKAEDEIGKSGLTAAALTRNRRDLRGGLMQVEAEGVQRHQRRLRTQKAPAKLQRGVLDLQKRFRFGCLVHASSSSIREWRSGS